ncbi:MAG: DUF4366 domain-containing protein [Lachnoclostridium sp.]|nr:DUF4366 domain-containing protein [Lachnoclostridium sp.]
MSKFDFSKIDMMSKDAVAKMEEMIHLSRLNDFLNKKEEEEKHKNCILWILAIIGAVAAIAAIAYAVYRFFTPDYLEDFEDDFFEDEFDDDFFEDEDSDPIPAKKEAEEV